MRERTNLDFDGIITIFNMEIGFNILLKYSKNRQYNLNIHILNQII